jgi:hypothetical protein
VAVGGYWHILSNKIQIVLNLLQLRSLKMNEERFKTLWEYADIGSIISSDQLLKVCMIYAGSVPDGQDDSLRAAVQQILAVAGDDAMQVQQAVLNPASDIAKLLSSWTSAPSAATSGESKLKTILDKNFEDDDDDSSVADEQVSLSAA